MWKEGFRLLGYDTRIDTQTFWLVTLCAILVLTVYCAVYSPKTYPRSFLKFLLAEYTVVVLLLTVFLRDQAVFPEGYRLSFLSDKSMLIENGLSEIIANVLLFVPYGFLLYAVLNKFRWFGVLVSGLAFSLTIEMLQFYMQRGVADVNDVIFNCVGLLIGCVCCLAVKRLKMFL